MNNLREGLDNSIEGLINRGLETRNTGKVKMMMMMM